MKTCPGLPKRSCIALSWRFVYDTQRDCLASISLSYQHLIIACRRVSHWACMLVRLYRVYHEA